MQPRDLKPEQFALYPPEAKRLAEAHVPLLRELPLCFVPSLLREIIEYDFKFPAERASIDRELAELQALSAAQRQVWFQSFAQVSLSSRFESLDWVNQPAQFIEQESAYLWTTHQLDAFRSAATSYGERLQAAAPSEPLPLRRLGVAVIGQGVASYDQPLFRNLRKHGTYFSNVNPDEGLQHVLSAAAARAKTYPTAHAHWYVDGGQAAGHDPLLTRVSYTELAPVRGALLKCMQREIAKPGMGPEELRSYLARLSPSDVGMGKTGDEVLNRFQLKLLSEGSGTQIFSTTFAQWTVREALRRAQPLTLVARFAPRQRQKPMNELLAGSDSTAELDPLGSLIDADMAAYYHWINQQRLPGSESSSFLVWFEGHNQALAIAPSLPRGTQSNSAVDVAKLLSLATS